MLLSVFIVYRTLDNYIVPALFFKVAKRGCLLRLFFYWGKLALASLLDL